MMEKPLAIDLYCGVGGWTDGLLAEGYDVIGFDIERHVYGEHSYPAQLVLQDVLTLHGSQFKDAALIVGSSPCQEFSYRAMPWKRAKALGPPELGMALFHAQFRIQREACEAAGRHIPMVVENVKGAQPWVGRARGHYGSFYLWGDVPALMPIAVRVAKAPGMNWSDRTKGGQDFTRLAYKRAMAASDDGVKGFTPHGQPLGKNELGRRYGSKSKKRKEMSALIAKIPLPLARHIAAVYHPRNNHE